MSFLTPVIRSASRIGFKPQNCFGAYIDTKIRSYHMSLVPYLMRELLQDIERPTLYDQNFAMGLSPTTLLNPSLFSHPYYLRPFRLLNELESGTSNVVCDKDSFKVNLDVQQFKPDELTVKIVDNHVVVEGKHEERSDEHGSVSRHFTRRYRLPDNVDADALQSALSSDGVLQLIAPIKVTSSQGERSIPIKQTNAPAVKAAESANKDENNKTNEVA